MNIRKLAWKNLLRRKSRAVFTGLGIFLGIATFVAISSITSQMEGAVQDQLDRFGAGPRSGRSRRVARWIRDVGRRALAEYERGTAEFVIGALGQLQYSGRPVAGRGHRKEALIRILRDAVCIQV
ncbi:MAG: ABC transporter permease [Desulfobacteria bacterium]